MAWNPEGPETKLLRTEAPKAIIIMVFKLNNEVSGPSGENKNPKKIARRKERACFCPQVRSCFLNRYTVALGHVLGPHLPLFRPSDGNPAHQKHP